MNRRAAHRAELSPERRAEALARLAGALGHLADLLRRIGNPRADAIAGLVPLLEQDPTAALRALDGSDWWAGAGSLAADSMADNPGLPERDWQREVADFRVLLIDIAEALRLLGASNPGLPSWLMAFRNWQASQVQ